MASKDGATFRPKTISEILKLNFKDPEKTKVNNDALVVVTEILRIQVVEAAMRASHQAEVQGENTVSLEHLEKILPQLLLDF